MTDAPLSTGRQVAAGLRSIRYGEVLLFQASPLLGLAFAGGLRPENTGVIMLFVAANSCLFAHVFALNDWGNLEADLLDPSRADATFVCRAVSPGVMLGLAIALAVVALAMFAVLGLSCLVLGAFVVGLSVLYSHPDLDHKGRPLVSTLNHFAGGIVPFALGYAAIRPVDLPSVAMGFYFAIVLMAGHLVQELRDFEGDRTAGVTTNVVRFGQRRMLLVSAGLFAASYAYLGWLGSARFTQLSWTILLVLAAVHALAWGRTWASALQRGDLRRYQLAYRLTFGCIGAFMLHEFATRPPVFGL